MILKYEIFWAVWFLCGFSQAYADTPDLEVRVFGWVLEKGTRKPLGAVSVSMQVQGYTYHAVSQDNGAFVINLPEGHVSVECVLPGYETLHVRWENQKTGTYTYQMHMQTAEAEQYVVQSVGRRTQPFIQPFSLRNDEITRVAGTQGDPFKVINTMPGVVQMMSLLPYAMVRGTSPDSTGFFLDSVRIPQLFHMFAGPSVVHPQFIDKVEYFPGHYPVQYGGYLGGVVGGVSKKMLEDTPVVDVDADMTKAGFFVGSRIPGVSSYGSVAARYGYPKAVLALTGSDVSASFWDYQARVDVGKERRLKLFVFGSSDELATSGMGFSDWNIRSSFHRVQLSYQHGNETLYGLYDVVWGVDALSSSSSGMQVQSTLLEPHVRWYWNPLKNVQVRAGIRMSNTFYQQSDVGNMFRAPLRVHVMGAYVESQYAVAQRLFWMPGVRTDAYVSRSSVHYVADPKMHMRLKLGHFYDGEAWLKAGVSYVHQPARFTVPVVGVQEFVLQQGMSRSLQYSAGFEWPLSWGLRLDIQVYQWKAKPLLLDVQETDALETLLTPASIENTQGRSKGLEACLKRDWNTWLYGWLAYTWSVSERMQEGSWRLFAYDRRHVLKGVAGVRLPQKWDVAVTAQYQTRSPSSSGSYRVDVRVDKQWLFQSWRMDVYLDVMNVTYASEDFSLVQGRTPNRYVLPSVGLRVLL
jgi:hypothetical protein